MSPSSSDAFRRHWPEYMMEAAGLGFFMLSACLCTALVAYSGSPVARTIPSPILQRCLIAVAMGLTAIVIIYSPWGRQSGAHINPAVTLTFWRLGKIATPDALFYMLAQFVGGTAGVLLSKALLGRVIADPTVNYAVTVPGPRGMFAALLGECVIAFATMTVVLFMTSRPQLERWTGLVVGLLVALYVAIESPLSGFGMNPARTFSSALPSGIWTAGWIYFVVPPLAMLLAAHFHVTLSQPCHAGCAKMHHCPLKRCIFCGYRMTESVEPATDDVALCNATEPRASKTASVA
ncbi:MAG TPA: aquaporin [Phycisphaerae bacterium]|nr:aquaporin [Phycisphaerae bacterium]